MVGMRVRLPSPPELEMYRFAIQISCSVAFSSHCFQCSSFVSRIRSEYCFLHCLASSWIGWPESSRSRYDSALRRFLAFLMFESSFVHHLFEYGEGLLSGTCS